MSWFWTRPDWRTVPKFDESIIVLAQKASVRERELLHRTGADVLDILIGEAMTQSLSASYSIEGEKLDSSALRSSVVRQLGLDIPEWRAIGRERSGKEDRAVFAALSFLNADWTLSPSALCRTHRMLEPGIEAWGRFRTEPEYIVDGSARKVYEAPPPSDVPSLMRWFCDWWNEDRGKLPPGIGAAMATFFSSSFTRSRTVTAVCRVCSWRRPSATDLEQVIVLMPSVRRSTRRRVDITNSWTGCPVRVAWNGSSNTSSASERFASNGRSVVHLPWSVWRSWKRSMKTPRTRSRRFLG